MTDVTYLNAYSAISFGTRNNIFQRDNGTATCGPGVRGGQPSKIVDIQRKTSGVVVVLEATYSRVAWPFRDTTREETIDGDDYRCSAGI